MKSGLLLVAALSGASAPLPGAAAERGPRWSLACHAGRDGGATNCIARRPIGRATLEVRTADSQLFAAIRHPRCRTNYRNFDRTDLAGLARGRRYATINLAFAEIRAEFRRTCPSLNVPAIGLDGMPDITIHPNRSDH